MTPSDTQQSEQQQQHQFQSASTSSSSNQEYVAITVATSPVSAFHQAPVPTSHWEPSVDLGAATSSCPDVNQPLATWQQQPPPPTEAGYYQHPMQPTVQDYWTETSHCPVPMLARPLPAAESTHTMTHWAATAPAPPPEPVVAATAQEELPRLLQIDVTQQPPDTQPPQPQTEQPIDTAENANKGPKRKRNLRQDIMASPNIYFLIFIWKIK